MSQLDESDRGSAHEKILTSKKRMLVFLAPVFLQEPSLCSSDIYGTVSRGGLCLSTTGAASGEDLTPCIDNGVQHIVK